MSIDEINALTLGDFIARFGALFEHSPWIVEQAALRRPFADLAAMQAAMMAVVRDSPEAQQLDLLRAHPELADKLAIARGLTADSAQEQASAGLDRLSEAEFAEFHALNRAYRQRFGFPFIICVRLTDKPGILAAMQQRLGHTEAAERTAALDEVAKIVGLRLKDAVRS